MRPLVVALAVLAALGAASPARAWSPPPTDEGRLAAYLPIARAAWPDSPCAGREVVHLHADAELAAFDLQDGVHSAGRAQPASCEVWLASNLSAGYFCEALVHEFGHDAGYGHTGVPGDVQAPGPQATVMGVRGGDWPACVTAVTGTLRDQADTFVRESLPQNGHGWTVTCTLMTVPRPRCLARWQGRLRRFSVRIVAGAVLAVDPVATTRPWRPTARRAYSLPRERRLPLRGGRGDVAGRAWRPSCAQARNAARLTIGVYANTMDHHLVLGACAARGRATRVVRVRVTGPSPERFRVYVTGSGGSVVVRARRL
jgi:hypothetical protein